MEDAAETPAPAGVRYSYKPSLFGKARQFTLTDSGIVVGSRPGMAHIAYGDVRAVRMSYRPGNMQSQRYLTEIWSARSPRLSVFSSSYKSIVEAERQDVDYNAFVVELHAKLAEAGSTARFIKGIHPVMFWIGFGAVAGIVIGMLVLIGRALLVREWSGAGFIAVFLVLFVWQGYGFLTRNRPGAYRPDAPPRAVMPVPKA